VAALEEHGLLSAGLAATLIAIRERDIHVHSLMIIRGGEVIVVV
jgi:hypothetical protein